ncbi:hypothetical protein, partial [Aliivibrio kagoshimensis]|uniref:hypothetical protein n=1 Tax=Aliivibrio kagoshimensis TaxID=2910230 RepID=UPI003D10EEE5
MHPNKAIERLKDNFISKEKTLESNATIHINNGKVDILINIAMFVLLRIIIIDDIKYMLALIGVNI